MIKEISKYERNNALTHGLGIVLSLVGIPFLLYLALKKAEVSVIVGTASFCIGLLAVFISSTAYHLASEQKLKFLLRKVDHIAIYFLIGGSYTAYILYYLNENGGLIFLLVHWSIIALGIIFKLFYTGKYEIVSTLLYLFLGWMVLPIIKPLTENMSDVVFNLVLAGGIAYSVGVIFYVWEKYEINHAIWHIFVLLGSGFHFYGLYYSFL